MESSTGSSRSNSTHSGGIMRRFIAVIGIVFVAAVGYLSLFIAPAIFPLAAYQDECTFGEVTKAHYLELLGRAHRLASRDWDASVSAVRGKDREHFAKILQDEFEEITDSSSSAYEKIAAMHAVLRANHAQYTSVSPDVDDPFGQAEKKAMSYPLDSPFRRPYSRVMFNYRLNVVWFLDLSISHKWARVFYNFYVANAQDSDNGKLIFRNKGDMPLSALLPTLDPGVAVDSAPARSCPPVPISETR